MTRRIPGQGRHPVTGLDPHAKERIGHALGPVMNLSIVGADNRPLNRARNDLAVGVPLLGMVQQLIDGQRPVLHQTKHGHFP